jgi:hypothetical protein
MGFIILRGTLIPVKAVVWRFSVSFRILVIYAVTYRQDWDFFLRAREKLVMKRG